MLPAARNEGGLRKRPSQNVTVGLFLSDGRSRWRFKAQIVTLRRHLRLVAGWELKDCADMPVPEPYRFMEVRDFIDKGAAVAILLG